MEAKNGSRKGKWGRKIAKRKLQRSQRGPKESKRGPKQGKWGQQRAKDSQQRAKDGVGGVSVLAGPGADELRGAAGKLFQKLSKSNQ